MYSSTPSTHIQNSCFVVIDHLFLSCHLKTKKTKKQNISIPLRLQPYNLALDQRVPFAITMRLQTEKLDAVTPSYLGIMGIHVRAADEEDVQYS